VSDPTPGDVLNERGGFRTDVVSAPSDKGCFEPYCVRSPEVRVAGVVLCRRHGGHWLASQFENAIHRTVNREGGKS
jgi:hypothetical protein